MVKRSPASYEDGTGSSSGPAAFGVEPLLPSSLRRRPSSPSQITQMVRAFLDLLYIIFSFVTPYLYFGYHLDHILCKLKGELNLYCTLLTRKQKVLSGCIFQFWFYCLKQSSKFFGVYINFI